MDELYQKADMLLSQNRLINVISFASSKVWLIEMMTTNGVVATYLHKEDPSKDECECKGYKKNGRCEHIIAGNQYLISQGFERQQQATVYNEPVLETPVQVLTHAMQREGIKQHIQETLTEDSQVVLEVGLYVSESYYLSQETALYVGVRIGKSPDKMYVVRDIATLVKAYVAKEMYALTKRESCHFKFDLFTIHDHDIMVLLQELMVSPLGYHYEYKNRLQVPHHLVQRFLALFQTHTNVRLELPDHKQQIHAVTNPVRLTVQLIQEDKQYTLRIPQKWEFFESIQCLYVEEQFGVVDPSAYVLYQQLWQLTDKGKTQEIVMTSQEQEAFFQYVYPHLEQWTHLSLTGKTPSQSLKDTGFISVIRLDSELCIALDEPLSLEQQYCFEKQMYHWGFLKRDNVSFVKPIDESWVSFVTEDVFALETYGQLQFDEWLEKTIVRDSPEIDMLLSGEQSLFTMAFQMDGITQEEVDAILQTVQEKKPYYEFLDGRLLSLETPAFDKVNRVLAQLRQNPIKNGEMQLTRLDGLQLTQTIADIKVSHSIQELIDDLKNPERLHLPLPKRLKATLKPYQQFGFQWLSMLSKHGLGGVLADDMGLGKTVQSITYLLSQYELDAHQKPSLIITPASLIYNWAHECQQFAPDLPIVVVNGTKKEREAIYQTYRQQSVVFITSYPSFRSDASWYHQDQFHAVILDESQIVKNHLTKQHNSLRDLSYHCLFALSGTPIENRKEDLWSIYALVLPGLLPNITEYRRLDEQKIAKMIKPFLLRRLKTDVLLELPDKLESVVYNDLSKEQKKLYIGYLQRMQETVLGYDAKTFQKNRIEILTGLTRLRQLCCDPRLFIANYKGASGKLEQCKEMVLTALAGQHRVLIFSQFASMLTILEEELNQLGVTTFKLTGQTAVHERQQMVNAFNSGDKQVFLMSLKAGGVGLNLTSADTIILYDLWWNPAVEEQATSRAHRMGQKNTVQVYRLISQGTIEEKIMQLQQKKRDLLDDMLTNETTGIQTRQSLSDADIKEILGIG